MSLERRLGSHSSDSVFGRMVGGRRLRLAGACKVDGLWWWCWVRHFVEQLGGVCASALEILRDRLGGLDLAGMMWKIGVKVALSILSVSFLSIL